MAQDQQFNRRDFITAASAGVAGAALSSPLAVQGQTTQTTKRRRYAIVGTGHRATGMWGVDLAKNYADVLEFVGLCDINHKRVEAAKKLIGVDCPTFTDFDKMCAEAKPDVVMVTTVDAVHVDYIVRALSKGIDVITEKPMVTDEKQAQRVLDAEKKYNRKITVTFNYRYSPKAQKIKELILAGEIGKVTSVDFSWYLDVQHGADYFRRWHRLKEKGGSLWVHKATHHFDLVNWFLDADPVEVTAYAKLNVYGKNGEFRYTNCRPCPYKSKCAFYWDMTKNERLMKLYAECEDVDGYHRDGCVFKNDCNIYDTMSAIVKYSNGVNMAYQLDAHQPFEGYSLSFSGTKGKIDVRSYERQPWAPEEKYEIYVTKTFGKREKIETPVGVGGHYGGDNRLRDAMFRNTPLPEYMKLPDSRAGAMSCMTGIAARTSVEQNRPVKIAELLKL